MKKGLTYYKCALALLLVLAGHIALGTGSTEKSSKTNFTLKGLNKSKSFVVSGTAASNYRFKGSPVLTVKKDKSNTLQVNSVIRYQSGNTTYVFPYKYKVKAPLFKTPAAPAIR
ncbi:MAG TPA: hypothetical protein VF145_09400 [Chitinophagaceae bacterium]